ncbi:MAG: HAD family hydrolase [Anaerolineales bacterium]
MRKNIDLIVNNHFEIVNSNIERGKIKHALFDFDGTLSLIREGWQTIMRNMMVELLSETPDCESQTELAKTVMYFIDETTGKQTIYQMIGLAEAITERGGSSFEPLEYKKMFLERMNTHIHERIKGLENGIIQPDEMIVPGVFDLLNSLKTRNVMCYLVSGTDDEYLKKEAAALNIYDYFVDIFGARDDYQNFSKKMVIENIMIDNQLRGPELIAFGDGFVEIEDTHSAGGISVGVASNEKSRHGIDMKKRERLINAGADIIIPDFRYQEKLIAYIFAEGQ